MGFPKSLRSIEIEQKCSFGFTLSFVAEWIEKHKSAIRQYAYICHNRDNDDHIHLLLWFYSPMPTDILIKSFGGIIAINHLEKIKKDESACAYLTHANRPEKVQYEVSEVITNIANFADITDKIKKLSNIQPLIDDIINGVKTENDIFTLENADIYLKHKKTIDNAFEFRYECLRKRVLKMEKDIQVIFCDGDSRTGKSSYWVEQCKKLNLSYCKSSSSNDPLQDYVDEELLILDDLRDSAFRIQDMLKFLDPHYRSSTQSRYHNKVFVGSVIVITTTQPLATWYSHCKTEQIVQFTARIHQHLYFEKDKIYMYAHKDGKDTNDFSLVKVVPNIMADIFKDYRNECYDMVNKLLGALDNQKPITENTDFHGVANSDGLPFV